MSTNTFVSFFLENQLFGLDIRFVREINKHLDITPVPHSAEYIKGLVNLRGQIITVIDLKRRLGLGKSDLSDVSHNIILKSEDELLNVDLNGGGNNEHSLADKASFLVDNIGDIIMVNEEEIEPPPANIGAIDGTYLSGVIKLDNTLMTILTIPKVLSGKSD